MFENYKQMSAEEKAQVKAGHKAIRSQTETRYGNLAWGFVRGFLYRRIERATRTQTMPDGVVVSHNHPNGAYLTYVLARAVPGFAEFTVGRAWATKVHPEVEAWLKNPDGAVKAPVREKKPFVRPEVA